VSPTASLSEAAERQSVATWNCQLPDVRLVRTDL
jgi:hypothetical protein